MSGIDDTVFTDLNLFNERINLLDEDDTVEQGAEETNGIGNVLEEVNMAINPEPAQGRVIFWNILLSTPLPFSEGVAHKEALSHKTPKEKQLKKRKQDLTYRQDDEPTPKAEAAKFYEMDETSPGVPTSMKRKIVKAKKSKQFRVKRGINILILETEVCLLRDLLKEMGCTLEDIRRISEKAKNLHVIPDKLPEP